MCRSPAMSTSPCCRSTLSLAPPSRWASKWSWSSMVPRTSVTADSVDLGDEQGRHTRPAPATMDPGSQALFKGEQHGDRYEHGFRRARGAPPRGRTGSSGWRPSGLSWTPQPSPVWFIWDGDTALIYSQPGTPSCAISGSTARQPALQLHSERRRRGRSQWRWLGSKQHPRR